MDFDTHLGGDTLKGEGTRSLNRLKLLIFLVSLNASRHDPACLHNLIAGLSFKGADDNWLTGQETNPALDLLSRNQFRFDVS